MKENVGLDWKKEAYDHIMKKKLYGTNKYQYGFDLPNIGLPANKRTILFAMEPDGSLYIKMEAHGLGSFREFVGHTFNFIETRKASNGIQIKDRKYSHCKEHVPKNIKKEFKKTISVIFPPGKPSFFERIRRCFGRKPKIKLGSEAEKLYERGALFGISEMERILNKEIGNARKKNINFDLEKDEQVFDLENGEKIFDLEEEEKIFDLEKNAQIITMRNLLGDQIRAARKRGYGGDVKGNEATLPPLGSDFYKKMK